MVPSETPQSLYDFFSTLAAGGAETKEKCELHYGCECVIHRALTASRMLLDVQKTLGIASSDSGPGTASEATTDDGKLADERAAWLAEAQKRETKIADEMDAQRRALEEAESEGDRLLIQNMNLTSENEQLQEKLIQLHKQIDRMYAKSEMTTLLDKLEAGEAEPKPIGDEEAEAEAEAGTNGKGGEAEETEEAKEVESSADDEPKATAQAAPEAKAEAMAEDTAEPMSENTAEEAANDTESFVEKPSEDSEHAPAKSSESNPSPHPAAES